MTDTIHHKCEHPCGGDCRCGCAEAGKKTATLVFRRDTLLYDISNLGYVEAEIMADEQQDAKHQTYDIGQDGNRDRVTRVLSLAMCEAVEALYPYTKHEIPDETRPMDDLLEDPDCYIMVLSLPKDFSATTLRLVRDLVHEYLVCRAMADWLSITKPDAAANWLAKGEEALSKVKTAITARRGKVRRPMSPF